MRQIILPLLIIILQLSLLPLTALAQVTTDIQDHRGRTVTTPYARFAETTSHLRYSISLTYRELYNTTDTLSTYLINLQTYSTDWHHTIPEGYHLLIKTIDDRVIDLTIAKPITIYTQWDLLTGTAAKTYETTASYTITQQQLQYIIDHRIIRIRQQRAWGLGYIDFRESDFTLQWSPSQTLSDQYNQIQHRIYTDNSIYSNF